MIRSFLRNLAPTNLTFCRLRQSCSSSADSDGAVIHDLGGCKYLRQPGQSKNVHSFLQVSQRVPLRRGGIFCKKTAESKVRMPHSSGQWMLPEFIFMPAPSAMAAADDCDTDQQRGNNFYPSKAK